MERKRLKKIEYLNLKESIDPLQFKEFYKNNCNDYVCNKYNIALCCMYKLIKDFNITLTPEEKRVRNKIATAQKVNMRYNITTGKRV